MIIFQNLGLLVLELLTLMGASVKQGERPIGLFGTGLKYAIATILRNGGTITIWRGLQKITLFAEWKSIRNKPFHIISMECDGVVTSLGITTDLGRNWHGWMAMRELESNVRDEQGRSFWAWEATPLEGYTTIAVDNFPSFEEAWGSKNKFFLSTVPVYSHPGRYELHDNPTENKGFFYRGIYVGDLTEAMPYTVNLLQDFSRNLTEDRTLNNTHVTHIMGMYSTEIKDVNVIEKLWPRGAVKTAMHDLDYDWASSDPSQEWKDYMTELIKYDILAVPSSAVSLLCRVAAIKYHDIAIIQETNDIQEAMLTRAREYLIDLGYDRHSVESYPVYLTDLPNGTYAKADIVERRIYFAPIAFDMGQKFVCSTLQEEYIHMHLKLYDMTRELQQHLFDRLATVMERFYYKEPI